MNQSTLNSNASGRVTSRQTLDLLSELMAAMPIVILFNAVRSALKSQPSRVAGVLQASSR